MIKPKLLVPNCVWQTKKSIVVTLGVGKDVAVELELKKLLSNDSLFYGADPMPENFDLFAPFGHFFPFAVGRTTGMKNASVLKPSMYVNLNMMHIGMVTFLQENVRQNTIDQLLMDCEGAEYELMPMMFKGGELDQAGITVCQINGEFHKGYLKKLHKVMLELLDDNRYIPLKVESEPHIRMFMVNIESPYCVQRYLANHFTA